MDMNLAVERIEMQMWTGDAKKDEDTSYRARVYSSNNELLAHTGWIGDNGQPAGEWIGKGTTYYGGENVPPWKQTFGEWRAAHPGVSLTTGLLKGGRLEIEMANENQDHWQVKIIVWAKVQDQVNLVSLSRDNGFQGVASDGEHNWPSSISFPLDLIVPG